MKFPTWTHHPKDVKTHESPNLNLSFAQPKHLKMHEIPILHLSLAHLKMHLKTYEIPNLHPSQTMTTLVMLQYCWKALDK
jgi:hypothetical protein